MVLVHGFGEHARRHATLAAAAAAAGHDFWAFDLLGHGHSPGAKAVVDGFDGPLAATTWLLREAAARSGSAPVLMGHSMGGAVALKLALSDPSLLSALALSSPFLIDAVPRPALQVAAARVIARVLPSLQVVTPDVTRISRDPAEVERYRSDPLIHHGGVPAVTGVTLVAQGAELLARASALSVPTLVVHGSDDGYAKVDGSRRLAAASSQVELFEVAGGYHELHHEPPDTGVPDAVRSRLLEWFARG